ncbi:MAG: hypothetical protein WDO13_01885 [Verrucomicrobiota bacterium]
MKPVALLLLLTAMLAAPFALRAAGVPPPDPLAGKIAAFQDAVKAAAPNAKTPAGAPGAAALEANFDAMFAHRDDPAYAANLESAVLQLLAVFPSDAAQQTGRDLLAEARRERDARLQAARAALAPLLRRVAGTAATAKSAADLDGVLADLARAQRDGMGTAPESLALEQQIAPGLAFVRQWQDYLQHRAAGEDDQARYDLQSLAQSDDAIGFIPRSRILALLAAPPPAAADATAPPPGEALQVADGIHSLDDLAPALVKLRAMSSRDVVARSLADRLAPMVEVYNDLKAGLPTSVTIDFMGGVSGPGLSARANVLLLDFILQHDFDTYRGAPPGDGEPPADYLQRVKADALARQDWPLLRKVVSAHAFIVRNVTGPASDDGVAGLDNFLAGLNQEAAQQYTLAVVSYETALKVPSTNVPAQAIGDHLQAIQRDHAADFAQGLQQFLSPPAQMRFPPPAYVGMNPQMYQRIYGGTFPGLPQADTPRPPPSPTLVIPGTATNAAPAK